MATREQCEQKLRASYWNRDAVKELSLQYRGVFTSNATWKTDDEFIETNIKDIVSHAVHRNDLDGLGLMLGIPTNAEQARIDAAESMILERQRHRETILWAAIGVLATALIAVLGWTCFKG